MCSFLLIFLLFTIVFTFFHDSAQIKFRDLQAQRPTQEGICTKAVVFAQNWSDHIDIAGTHQGQEHLFEASLTGSNSLEADCGQYFRSDGGRRSISMGLPMRQTQQEIGQPLCPLLGSLVQRHKTRCYTEDEVPWCQQSLGKFMGWMGRRMGSLGSGLGRHSECRRLIALLPWSTPKYVRLLPEKSSVQGQKEGQRKRQEQGQGRTNPKPLWCRQRWLTAIAGMAYMEQSGNGCIPFPVSPIQQEQYHAGDGDAPETCLQRSRSSSRCAGLSRKGGERVQPQQYQVIAGCYQELRSCPKSSERCGDSQKGSPSSVDQARRRRHQGLGSSVGELQSSSSHFVRACGPCKSRDRCLQAHPEGGKRELCQRGELGYPTTDPGRNGRCKYRQRGGYRGTEAARPIAECSERMCWIIRIASGSSGTTSPRGVRRRNREGATPQKAEIGRASEAWRPRSQAVTIGRELPVCQNGSHVAMPHMFPNGHSVTGERDYLSPLVAVRQAWKLRGEIFLQGDDRIQGLNIMHGCTSLTCLSVLKRKSCISQEPQNAIRSLKRVRFDDCIEIAMPAEYADSLYSTFVVHHALQCWPDKPWRYFPKAPNRRFSWRKLTNLSYPFSDFHECKPILDADVDETVIGLVSVMPNFKPSSRSRVLQDDKCNVQDSALKNSQSQNVYRRFRIQTSRCLVLRCHVWPC